MRKRSLLLGGAVIALLTVVLGFRENLSRSSDQDNPVLSTRASQAVDSDESPAGEGARDSRPQSSVAVSIKDGEIIREWGSFVRARDIAVNCVEAHGRTKCDSVTKFDHPYATFSDEQLSQIYETDDVAAYLYAHRLLIQPSEGRYRRLEDGLNVAIIAVIRSGEQQAFDLILSEKVHPGGIGVDLSGRPFDYSSLEDRLMWMIVGDELNLLSDKYMAELQSRSEQLPIQVDISSIRGNSEEIANLFRQQKLIVVGDEFSDESKGDQ